MHSPLAPLDVLAPALDVPPWPPSLVAGSGWCWSFSHLSSAMAHVERGYLAAALSRRLLPPPARRVRLLDVLATHAEELPLPPSDIKGLVAGLKPYFGARGGVYGGLGVSLERG